MLKYIVLFGAKSGTDRDRFRRRFASRIAPGFAANMPGLHRLVVNVLDIAPRWPRQPATAQNEVVTPYDVVAEMWFDTAKNACRVLHEPECAAAYRVTESIEIDEARDTCAPHSVKLFSFIIPVAGLADQDFRRHWNEHVPIARRVHAACQQYVRHWVEEALPGGAPSFRGIGMIGFRNQEDLEQRLFDSPEGVAEVVADTAKFVGDRLVVYATEYRDLLDADSPGNLRT